MSSGSHKVRLQGQTTTKWDVPGGTGPTVRGLRGRRGRSYVELPRMPIDDSTGGRLGVNLR